MNELLIKECIKEAKKSLKTDDVPVGAIIVKNNKIISRAHNCREKKKTIVGHAEIKCIEKANKKLKTWRLDGCILYTSLEPCLMCYEAINQSRINKVIYCASNELYGFHNYVNKKNNDEKFVLIENDESIQMLKKFFKDKRK